MALQTKQANYSLLGHLEKINDETKKCRLKDPSFGSLGHEMEVISNYFKVNRFQASFLAILFSRGHDGETVSFDEVVRHFDCSPLRLLRYQNEIDELVSGNFIRHKKSTINLRRGTKTSVFQLNTKLLEAVLQNQSLPELSREHCEDVMDVLAEIVDLEREDDLEGNDLIFAAKQIVKQNLHFPLIRAIDDLHLELEDTYILFMLIWSTIAGDSRPNIQSMTHDLFDTSSENIKYRSNLVSGKNRLVGLKLIEIKEASFLDDVGIALAPKGRKLLKEHGINIYGVNKRSNVILSGEITVRQLFFEEKTNRQLQLLKSSLKEEKLKEIRNRLIDRGLSEGVTTLFYGAPGTGKTEMAKQLARETGRDVMTVEISKTKSMWFGESEKIIKKVFSDYASFMEECDNVPILLFNEADAIFSKRRAITESNMVKTENAIQNIILEELENFKGILIATTNLQDNLDAAFERRFLFKVCFKKPDDSIRGRIWQSKLNCLSEEDAGNLSARFDFSGGEIDNIVRKWEIHNVVSGEADLFSTIERFCEEEKLGEKRTRSIGFGR